MADLWEMCEVSYDFNHVFFYTPKGAASYMFEAFMKKNDPSFKSLGNTEDSRMVICTLLSEGWEPFAEDEHEYFFRRKHQG